METTGSAFVAMHLHRLRKLITSQSDKVFAAWGIESPSSCVSVLLFLRENNAASITELAEALGYSHQLISQRLSKLEKQKFIARRVDRLDQRKSKIVLTRAGAKQADRVVALLPLVSEAYDRLFDELEVDLSQTLARVHESLLAESLVKRVARVAGAGAKLTAATRSALPTR